MAIEPCMCRGTVATWNDEDPFERQGSIHSPIGCLRRAPKDLHSYLCQVSGWAYPQMPRKQLFQVLILRLSLEPDKYPDVVTSPVPVHPPYSAESPGLRVGSKVGRGVMRVQKIPKVTAVPAWDLTTGKIKPPWEK